MNFIPFYDIRYSSKRLPHPDPNGDERSFPDTASEGDTAGAGMKNSTRNTPAKRPCAEQLRRFSTGFSAQVLFLNRHSWHLPLSAAST
jgi:hypothetical protein